MILVAIRSQVRKTRFSRKRFDENEIVNEVFVRLAHKDVHPTDEERFYDSITQCIRHTLRDYKLADKPALDVGELDDEEHPFYTMDAEWEEKEFEDRFQEFCESQEEPKRHVYALSRIHSKTAIAKIVGISRRSVSKLIGGMCDEFREFLRISLPRAH